MPSLRSFSAFVVVGSIGFVVEAGVLKALVSLADWEPILARLISFPVAVTTTWALNRHLAFANGRARKDLAFEWARYVAVNSVGGGINFAVFAALTLAFAGLKSRPIIALAIASALGLASNFLGSHYYVFGGRKRGSDHAPQ